MKILSSNKSAVLDPPISACPIKEFAKKLFVPNNRQNLRRIFLLKFLIKKSVVLKQFLIFSVNGVGIAAYKEI